MLGPSQLQLPPPQSWNDFEDMCWRLWRRLWNDDKAKKHGRQGQPQSGVDIFGCITRSRHAGVQCKKKDYHGLGVLTEDELLNEVEKAKSFRPTLKEFTVAYSGPRDATLQEVSRGITQDHNTQGLFSVDVWSWDDIRDELHEHEDLVALYYGGALLPLRPDDYHLELVSTTSEREADKTVTCTELRLVRRVDATFLPDAAPPPDVSFLPEEFFGAPQADAVATRRSTTPLSTSTSRVLSPQRSQILSLISTSPWEMTVDQLANFFPDLPVANTAKYLLKNGLLRKKDDGELVPPHRIQRSLLPSTADKELYYREWITALEKVGDHPDTAACLALQRMRLGETRQAQKLLVDQALGGVVESWAMTYVEMLSAFDCPTQLKGWSIDERVRFLIALGTVQTNAGLHVEAKKTFQRLRRFAKSKDNSYGIRQSYHNCGCVYLELGDMRRAEKSFRTSIDLCREADDAWLLGKSLYELAITIAEESPEEAEQHLNESERIKKTNGDTYGAYATCFGRAALALNAKDYLLALRYYEEAATVARSHDAEHPEALAICNQGNCFLDLGQANEALERYVEASAVDQDESADIRLLVLRGTGLARVAREEYAMAKGTFRELHSLQTTLGAFDESVVSLHDLGACQFHLEEWQQARKTLINAVRLARKHRCAEWVLQCQLDLSQTYIREGHVAKALSQLKQRAAAESRRNAFGIAAQLRLEAVQIAMRPEFERSEVLRTAEDCRRAAEDLSDHEACDIEFELCGILHEWRWRRAEYDDAIKDLTYARDVAKRQNDREMHCRFEDQLGICLQRLRRYSEASASHKKSVKIARRLKMPDLLAACLNNAGDCLRHLDRYDESVLHLAEAEKIARRQGDLEFAITIRHNKALAMLYSGKLEEANRLLVDCRNEARREKIWGQYVHALHGLANAAWTMKRPKQAEKLYRRAFEKGVQYKYESLDGLAVNFANALRWNGNSPDALDVLQQVDAGVREQPYSHEYLTQLASLLDETGDREESEAAWREALEASKRTQDDDAIATAAGGLGEWLHESGQLKEAIEQYHLAISKETDEELQLQLLGQLLDANLALDDDAGTSRAYSQFSNLAERIEAYSEHVDALMMIGEHLWASAGTREDALEAFFSAFLLASHSVPEQLPEIGVSISAILCDEGRSPDVDIIEQSKSIVRRWLSEKQDLDLDEPELNFICWPISAARRIAMACAEGIVLTEKQMLQIAEEEASTAIELLQDA